MKKQNQTQHRSCDINSTLLELKRAGGRHFKWFYLYIFAGNHPFLMEFGVRMRTLIPSAVRYRKSKFWQFNMVDHCYIENLFRLYLSVLLSDLEWCSGITAGHMSRDLNADPRWLGQRPDTVWCKDTDFTQSHVKDMEGFYDPLLMLMFGHSDGYY